MVEEVGREAVAMRPLAERLKIRAPSIYKHFKNREQIKREVVIDGLQEMGDQLHEALRHNSSVKDVLTAYRLIGLRNPNLYRLCTAGELHRERLPSGLEEWAGSAFYVVTEDEYTAPCCNPV